MELPFFSVLLAVRNEETHLPACLNALNNLQYPKERFEILIGNDDSEDGSLDIIEKFISDKPNFTAYTIKEQQTSAKGKSNVLAQLAQKAKGDFFLYTDADVRVPVSWIESYVEVLNASTSDKLLGIVTGFTIPRGNTLFHHLQTLEWTWTLGILYILSVFKIPVTAMGNNMMVRRTAYFHTGGFEKMEFSLTEDFQLFWAVVRKNYGFANSISPQNLAITIPAFSFYELFQQRKRWMTGVMRLALPLKIILILQANVFPILSVLIWWDMNLALSLVSLMAFSRIIVCLIFLKKIKQIKYMKYLICFELYFVFFYFLLFVYYFLPTGIQWKNRKY